MSSIPVPYSKSNGVLSCVSIIAQSCAIDKVYLVRRLQNALWNCHFLSELLFLSLCFLNVLTYNLLQELLFQKMQFFRANFQQTLEYLGSQIDALLFPLNTTTKTLPSKLLSQGSIEQNKLSTNSKNFRFWGI